MKKYLLSILILFNVLTVSLAQQTQISQYDIPTDINDINYYKYIVLVMDFKINKIYFGHFARKIDASRERDFITNFFISKNMPISMDTKQQLLKNNIDEHDILTCYYTITVNLFVKLSFYNADKQLVYYCEIPGIRKYKDIEGITFPFRNFTYSYNDYLSQKRAPNSPTPNTGNAPDNVSNTVYFKKPHNEKKTEQENMIEEKQFISDIDKNIPQTQKQYPNRFALIIGNEDYSTYQKSLRTEANVEYAANDAKTFKEYAQRTFGIDEGHIIYMINASSIEMNRAINQISMIIKSMNGNAEVFVYYAGHGFPDQNTKEPYLIPVDVTSTDLSYAIKLHNLYTKLTVFPSKRIVVFLDACFSGGGREQGLLASRGINIEPKNDLLTGNIIVFSSSSSSESSLPYDEKKHGMFTYFLLKEIQTTSGNITYKKLSDYLREQVNITSVINHAKEQIPEVNVSYNIKNSWENWSINN